MKYKNRLALFVGLVAVILAIPMSSGCMRTSVAAQGWSGIANANGQLFYLNTITGSGGGGFLSCSAPDSQSQMIILNAGDGGVANTIALPESTVFYGNPVISDGYAYVTGYNGRIYRINVTSGGTPQSAYLNTSKPRPIVGGAAVANGMVFAASIDGRLYALDATTLVKQWDFETKNTIWSTPAVYDNTVYIGSFDKSIYALNAASGEENWSYATQGAIVATPIVSGGLVYIASLDRHVYALDAASGELVWQYPTADATNPPRNWFWATPVLVDGKLYAPNTDGGIYIIDAREGSLVDKIDVEGSIISSPVAVGGNVIVATEEGDIYTINTATQRLEGARCRLRTVPSSSTLSNANLKVRASLSTANGMVYVQSTDPGRVFEFSPATNEAWEIGTRQSSSTNPPSPSSTATVTTTVTTTTTVTVTTTG